jgi:hypothetical protein
MAVIWLKKLKHALTVAKPSQNERYGNGELEYLKAFNVCIK